MSGKKSRSKMTSIVHGSGGWLLAAAFALGLVVRLAVLSQTKDLGAIIIDEQHYVQLADSLVQGHGFAWGPGQRTSIRPPLYPLGLAGIWTLFGEHSYQTVRIVQIVLSALTAALVYVLGSSLMGGRVGAIAAAVVWLYPSFVFLNVTLLTETLYTFLLTAFLLAITRLVQTPRPATAAVAGILFGLSCLTRSSLWPLPLVLCPLLALLLRAPLRQRLVAASVVFAGYAAVITPWAVRNTELQGILTIVDTMGGLNLRMGNYEYTPDDRMWGAVEILGDHAWNAGVRDDFPNRPPTEGEKDRWAQRKAIEYMLAHPGITLRRSLIRFADFWGLEREFAGGILHGFWEPPVVLGLLASVTIVLAYIVVSVSGFAGIWLAPLPDWRTTVLLLLPGVALMTGHVLVFGHSRYHIPLVPVLALYAAALWCAPPLASRPRWARGGAVASVGLLAAIWARQMLVDAARIQRFLADAG